MDRIYRLCIVIAMVLFAVAPVCVLAHDTVELGLATDTVEGYKWALAIPGVTQSRREEWVRFASRPFLSECSDNIGVVREDQSIRGPIESAHANGTSVQVRIYDTNPDGKDGCIIQAIWPR